MRKFYKFVYNQYIKEDWSNYNKIGKICIYPFWLLRVPIIYLISPLLVFSYFDKTNKDWIMYKEKLMEKFYEELEKLN